MGRPKALLPYGGVTFLECILAVLDANGVESVRVVVGTDARSIQTAVPSLQRECIVVNPSPGEGMLSSVRRGVCALPAGTESFLLWPVDHPLVRASTVGALIHTWRRKRPPLVVPTRGGKRGHPVLFDSCTVPELVAAPDEAGARHVVAAHERDRIELEVADGGVLVDIDTPEAYQAVFGKPVV
jgi:molybdenum cofactor cytidylyltransferase